MKRRSTRPALGVLFGYTLGGKSTVWLAIKVLSKEAMLLKMSTQERCGCVQHEYYSINQLSTVRRHVDNSTGRLPPYADDSPHRRRPGQ